MLTLYGIPNCDLVKKSQKWLHDHNIGFTFHNFKEKGISKSQLIIWCQTVPWELLLNKRSITWKELSEKDKSNLTQAKAITLMQKHPTLIKRSVAQRNKSIEVGFDSKKYTEHFK